MKAAFVFWHMSVLTRKLPTRPFAIGLLVLDAALLAVWPFVPADISLAWLAVVYPALLLTTALGVYLSGHARWLLTIGCGSCLLFPVSIAPALIFPIPLENWLWALRIAQILMGVVLAVFIAFAGAGWLRYFKQEASSPHGA